MSRDTWRDAIRVGRGDPAALCALLDELPADGLQHAGNAVLTLPRGSVSEAMAVELLAALRDRAWNRRRRVGCGGRTSPSRRGRRRAH